VTLLSGQCDLPNCGRAGPSLIAAMTLVVAADRSSALTRLSPFPCHPTYDRLVRNGPVKQRSHIGKAGRLPELESGGGEQRLELQVGEPETGRFGGDRGAADMLGG